MSEPQDTVTSLGLTVESEFIPFSKSRNAKPDAKVADMSLNWHVRLMHQGQPVIETEYSAGIGHCKAYKQGSSLCIDDAAAIKLECQTGSPRHYSVMGPIKPNTLDVIHSLLMDGEAINYDSFEEWAGSFGFDPDSKKAEAVYRTCLDFGLKLRNALGDEKLSALQEAFSDY